MNNKDIKAMRPVVLWSIPLGDRAQLFIKLQRVPVFLLGFGWRKITEYPYQDAPVVSRCFFLHLGHRLYGFDLVAVSERYQMCRGEQP